MADILIRGMEMPKRCSDCWLMDGEDSWCTAMRGKHLDGSYRYGIKDKPDWCPLIALPEGHGRLVDGEALYKKSVELEQQAMSYVKARDGEEWKMWAAILTERTAFKFDVVDAPTIVPAEEDEK